jgi:uncharacterized protein YbjT (DUF2867 family)
VKILVLGATGGTGTEIVKQASAAGYEIRVLVRDPAKLSLGQAGIEVAVGDATDRAAIADATSGVDAVLVALGSGHNRKSDLASRSAAVLTTAPDAGAPMRVVVLSSFGVGESLPMASPIQRVLYRTVLRRLFEDKAKADETWRTSRLDWTIVRPVSLTNGKAAAECAAAERLRANGFPRIARADVAQFMVTQANSNTWSRRTAILSRTRHDHLGVVVG